MNFIKEFEFYLLCCERHFYIYKRFLDSDSDWIRENLDDFWKMINEERFSIDHDALDENIEYLAALYKKGQQIIGADLIIGIIDLWYAAKNLNATGLNSISVALLEDIKSYLGLVKFGEGVPYLSTAEVGQSDSDGLWKKEEEIQSISRQDILLGDFCVDDAKAKFIYDPLQMKQAPCMS